MYFKKLALCMALVMLFTLLAGCHEDVEMATGTPSIDFESQAHIPVGTPDDSSTIEESVPKEESTTKEESIPKEQSQPPLTGDFVVNQKKYDYKGGNIELLHVENKTNNHLNITINGKYLDKDGKVIKEETQKFGAFPSGWSNYFIFHPRCAYDSFTYVLETEEYTERTPCILYNHPINHLTTDSDGNPLASYINFTYEKKLTWRRALIGDLASPETLVEGRLLYFFADMDNSHPTATIEAKFHVLVLDADGNIYATDYDLFDLYGRTSATNASTEPAGVPRGDGHIFVTLTHQPIGGDESIPDNVQNVFTVIFAINEVYDFHDNADQYMKLS